MDKQEFAGADAIAASCIALLLTKSRAISGLLG